MAATKTAHEVWCLAYLPKGITAGHLPVAACTCGFIHNDKERCPWCDEHVYGGERDIQFDSDCFSWHGRCAQIALSRLRRLKDKDT